jgi:DNA polymerase III subunit epsilon
MILRRPRARTPWREADWCAVDLELTGLDPRHDEIIAIGAVPVTGGRVVLGEAVYTLARSSRQSARAAVLLHKLRVADLAQAPPLPDALGLLAGTLGDRIPVFHTAAVERAFLGRVLGRRRQLSRAADTEVLGRLWLTERGQPVPAGLPLAQLAARLGAPAEAPHHALGDALTTACAFIALATHLESFAPQTVGSLTRARAHLAAARRFGPG